AVRLRVQHARQDGSDQRGDLAVPRFVRVQRAGGARDHVADMDEADAARAERQRLGAQALAQRPDPALGPGAEPVTAGTLGDADTTGRWWSSAPPSTRALRGWTPSSPAHRDSSGATPPMSIVQSDPSAAVVG